MRPIYQAGRRVRSCHPALDGNPTIASNIYVLQVVMYGNRGMPGFAGFLDDEQIATIVNYVRGDLGDNAYAADHFCQ